MCEVKQRTAAGESDCVRSTREMIERAVSLAFTDATPLDQTAFEDPRESVDSSPLEWDHQRETQSEKNSQHQSDAGRHEDAGNKVLLEKQVAAAVDSSKILYQQQRERREMRAQQIRAAEVQMRGEQEFHQQLAAAAFAYQQRKLAVQALQARIEREIQYLQSTAADLSKRVRSQVLLLVTLRRGRC